MGKETKSQLSTAQFEIKLTLFSLDNVNFHDGASIHGRHPLHLVEKIIRERIQASLYWKEKCYGLSGKSTWIYTLR